MVLLEQLLRSHLELLTAIMSMKLYQLHKLKEKLLKGGDFSEIWTFYMDKFADRPEFTEMGEPVKSEFLEAVIPQICQKMFGKKVKINDLFVIYIAEYQFFHAPFVAEGRVGGVIYFEEENIGLLAIATDFPQVGFSRFSGPPAKLTRPGPYDRN